MFENFDTKQKIQSTPVIMALTHILLFWEKTLGLNTTTNIWRSTITGASYLEFSITLKSTRTCPENHTNKMWTTMPETLTRDSEIFYSVKGKKSSKLFSLP